MIKIAIYHLEAKVISRGSGRSACAASAYMSCSRIYNDYDGVQHDYTRKRGLIWEHVFLPEHAPQEWQDREVLWNAVESAEKSKDSRLAREFVVALPTELDQDDWISLLTEYVREQFVSDGMCADVAIHDTDGHNPHAHILLTVRPLMEDGSWQKKTEKEYLCMKAGVEYGFTAAEYKAVRKDGWEKQYPYFVGKKKKKYMTPSAAEAAGYERASKYPKSTKYGRQNPISARWNSENQLLRWRENWANTVNRALEDHKLETRIDHRSFADRGLVEQPTIHEGYIARDMEKQDLIADRCEINRQIRADNRLLRTLQEEVERLRQTITDSIEFIALALETIRGNMVRCFYHLQENISRHNEYAERYNKLKPVLTEYKSVKQKLNAKQVEKKVLMSQKQNTGLLQPVRRIQLTQQITSLSEEIEELKSQKKYLMSSLYCRSDSEMQSNQKTIERLSQYIDQLKPQREALNTQIEDLADRFAETRSKANPGEESELLDERIRRRDDIRDNIVKDLKETFGKQMDYERLRRASERTDERLNEDPEVFRIRRMDMVRDLQMRRRRNRAFTIKHFRDVPER